MTPPPLLLGPPDLPRGGVRCTGRNRLLPLAVGFLLVFGVLAPGLFPSSASGQEGGISPDQSATPSEDAVISADEAGASVEGTEAMLHRIGASSRAEPRIDDISDLLPMRELVRQRLQADFAAMRSFRPGYPFWRHIFQIPDGYVAFGSAEDGRLLATFPVRGDWRGEGSWEVPAHARLLEGRSLPRRLRDRREEVERLLEAREGPVLHNRTRGMFVLPNARRYGSFLDEWGTIYERFGVPAEIGLAKALVESGLNGRVRSEHGALGFCQWLRGNWLALKRLAPHEIEGYNQTTQASYCAAYLTVLAAKYGSFIPALSEHHAGAANVGRTLINGERLEGQGVRERYFFGARFALDLREISGREFRRVVRTYGPRSFRYSEMVFGNTLKIREMRDTIPQERIHAMRAPRPIPLSEVTRRTGFSTDEVRRFNPALVRQVPRGATLYLPTHVEEFGHDVSFWHREATSEFASVLDDFLRLDASVDEWNSPSFEPVLREFERRFRETETEEGTVLATVLAYVREVSYRSDRAEILAEYRTDPRILSLFERGVRARQTLERSLPASR